MEVIYPDQVPYEACPRCGKIAYKKLGRIVEGGLEVRCYECGEIYLIFGSELREKIDKNGGMVVGNTPDDSAT